MEPSLSKTGHAFYCAPYPTYLCGPMHFKTHEEMSGWRNYVKARLEDCHDPVVTEVDKSTPVALVHQDLTDIENSCFVIATYDGTSPSVGSSMEMFFAKHNLKPARFVFTVTDCDTYSPWLEYHSDKIFKANGYEGYDQAIHLIKQIKEQMYDFNGHADELENNISTILR